MATNNAEARLVERGQIKAEQAFDISLFFAGVPSAGQAVLQFAVPPWMPDQARRLRYQLGASAFNGSVAKARVAATAESVFNIESASLGILGTITFAAAADVGIFAAVLVGSEAIIPDDDVISITGPDPADATLEDISIYLRGTLL